LDDYSTNVQYFVSIALRAPPFIRAAEDCAVFRREVL
jgi:hypothetical protein